MNQEDTVELLFGGPGSRCNPETGPCGRKPGSKHGFTKAEDILKAAEELYGDKHMFRMMMNKEIKDAYPMKSIKGWPSLTNGQKKVIAKRCHAKAQDRKRAAKSKNRGY